MTKQKPKYRPVTIWRRWNQEKQETEFNHIQFGWSYRARPDIICESQRKHFKTGHWYSELAWLDENNKVTRNPELND